MGITSTITHRLLALSRPGLILNRGLNACIIPSFIVTSRSLAAAAAAKKPTTKTAAAVTPKTAQKSSTEGGGTKKTSTTTKAAGKTGSTTEKPTTPKTASGKPVKKVAAKEKLTDEDKKKLLIKQLRKKALKPPPKNGISGYTLWFGEMMKEGRGPAAKLAVEWKALPQDVRDAYTKQSEAKKPANAERYKEWIESMSPLVIREANNARRRLKDLGIITNISQISDDRFPKRITRPFLIYVQEQYGAGRKFLDAAGKNNVIFGNKVLTEEYKNLPESEKKRFEDMVKKNKEDYDTAIAKLEKQRNI